MSRPRRTPEDFDSPWKDALPLYFPFFLAFFFNEIYADIDWSRGYESLDKELHQIVRRASVGKRLADKLFKVWLRDGVECWLLIHVEVQGDYEKAFAARMFDYNSAVRRLYNREVVSLAVLCDDRIDWRPTVFGYGRWGCRMELTFRIAKLLDYAGDVAALEQNDNPFATVVLAHAKALETGRDPQSRQQWKLRLVKGLYRGNWSKDDIRQLFRLIDWLMTLPEDLEEVFREELYEYEKERRVEYITSIERHGFKRGMKRGIKKGVKEGVKEGIAQGERQGLIKAIALLLEAKFGSEGKKLLRKVRTLPDATSLVEFTRGLQRAGSMEEVRAYFQ